jgi:hypothetical protein
MYWRKKVAICGITIVAAATICFLGIKTETWGASKTVMAAPVLPYAATMNGPYRVQGNTVVDKSGQAYVFHGIGRDGLEYRCSGDQYLDRQHLAFMGTALGNSASKVSGTYWGANTVRLPLSEGFWLHGSLVSTCTAQQYQALVKQTVDNLTALKLNVMLDLQWVDAGGQSKEGGGPWPMPDADSVTFWQQAASLYKGYPNVLFELYNEPHPDVNRWPCWLNGCAITKNSGYSDDCHCTKTVTYQAVGMQKLVDTVRGTGATNLALVAGVNWGYDLSQVLANHINGANIVYDTHPYPYQNKGPATWDTAFGNLSASVPVISAESGEYDCGSSYEQQLLTYFDAHRMSWVAWAWAVQGTGCGYPLLIQDALGAPSPGFGQYVYQHMQGYTLAHP